MVETVQMSRRKPSSIDLMGIIQHLLYLGAYRLLVLAAIGKACLVIVEQGNVPRLPDLPGEDACDVPSDLNSGLERPVHTVASARDHSEIIGSVVMGVLRMGGHGRFSLHTLNIAILEYRHPCEYGDIHEFEV